jgi:hypothetical protein
MQVRGRESNGDIEWTSIGAADGLVAARLREAPWTVRLAWSRDTGCYALDVSFPEPVGQICDGHRT